MTPFGWLQSFFKNYDYKHTAVCLAADAAKGIVFSLSVDSEVQPKEGVFTKLNESESAPSRCISKSAPALILLKDSGKPSSLAVYCHPFLLLPTAAKMQSQLAEN